MWIGLSDETIEVMNKMKKEKGEEFKTYLVKKAEKLDWWWLPQWVEEEWEKYNEKR